MYPSLPHLKKILLSGRHISRTQSLEAEAADSVGFVANLIQQGALDSQKLGQALAKSYRLPYIDLSLHSVRDNQQEPLPEAIAQANRVVLVSLNRGTAIIATDNPVPIDLSVLQALYPKTKIRLMYALPECMNDSLSLYRQPLLSRYSRIIGSGQRVAPEIVDEIIKEALSRNASDIHFEPQPDIEVQVRIRVDGDLRDAGWVPKEYYENILNRIKMESGMRIDEHYTAQDGVIRREQDGRVTDLRVSLVPTVNGEKVVMRVLGSYVQELSLTDLGLGVAHRSLLEAAAAKPFGMILVVGPTGSGKTTTLYAIMKLLNRGTVNITSIEDPVEYKMAGVNQIQVQEAANMTFAKGLRSIVRQDPDVILVGEIRDAETAEISVNAALTGHLLLSTLHANDAATAVPRLIDMGIEPFLLGSTLEVVIAQRLVRKICSGCRQEFSVREAAKLLGHYIAPALRYLRKTDTVYMGMGCDACGGTGYVGRTALFAFLEITAPMQELIARSPAAHEVEELARSQGGVSMFEDGLDKVKSGVTTIAEVLRVVEPPRPAKRTAR